MMVAITFGLLGCANQLESNGTPNNGLSTGSGGTQGSNQPPAPVDPWTKAQLESTGYTNIAGSSQKVTGVDKADQTIVLNFPMSENLFPEMEMEIPDLPGAKLVSRKEGDKTILQFRIPIKYILKGAEIGNPQRLPNGDPLPQVPGGELPALAVTVPIKDVKVTLYIGAEVLGIYVEVGFDPKVKLAFPIKTKKEDGSQERTLGYFNTIPVKNPYRGGFFLSLLMPPDLARILDELINGA